MRRRAINAMRKLMKKTSMSANKETTEGKPAKLSDCLFLFSEFESSLLGIHGL